jgi:hypothetical protein
MAPSAITWKRLSCEVVLDSGGLQDKEKCDDSSGILRSVFLIRTGGIFVDETALSMARDGLKSAATAGAVRGLSLWPVRITAFQVTEFHWQRFPYHVKKPRPWVGLHLCLQALLSPCPFESGGFLIRFASGRRHQITHRLEKCPTYNRPFSFRWNAWFF